MTDPQKTSRAEEAFRQAFARLKEGRPEVLPRNTRFSQNAVAKEAGYDPSALKKARFPDLVREIQQWVEHTATKKTPPSRRQLVRLHRIKIAEMKRELAELKAQRDDALSKLVEADSMILKLRSESQEESPNKVTSIWARKRKLPT